MIPFCDNIHCRMHKIPAAPQTQVLDDNYIITYTRYDHGNGLHLCSICTNAVYLSVGQGEGIKR